MNLERTHVLFFYYFVYLKVNLDLKLMNQLGESLPNFIFAVVNLDLIVLEKRWTDGESWPYDFVVKVNRGEDLRWVGSRWPLTHTLKLVAPSSTHEKNKLTWINLLLRSKYKWKLDGPSLAQEVNWGQRSNFSILCHFHASLTLCANVEKLQKTWEVVHKP